MYSADSKWGIIAELIVFDLIKGVWLKKTFFLVMTSRYDLFKKFENNEYASEQDLKKITDYICGNLNNWTPNYHYWYNMYSYTSKAYIVCQWREERGRMPTARWGEAICKSKLTDFFEDTSHQNCACESAYYNFFFFFL